jgi:hypothetical protein
LLILPLIIFNGCKNDIVTPANDQSLSSIQVHNGILYNFSVPRRTFGKNDTLNAQLTAFNQTLVPDTFIVGVSTYLYNWTLTNAAGKVIMSGPMPDCAIVEAIPVNPRQEIKLYQIKQVIRDQLDEPITAGSYVLQWNLNNNGAPCLSFKLNIEIQ